MNQKVKKVPGAKIFKRKWPWITGVIVLIAVIAVVVIASNRSLMPASAASGSQSVTVERGNITNTIVGTGNLAYGSSADIKLPSDLLIDEVLADSGDYVEKGDVIATVNPSSVQTLLEQTQDEIASLDSEINSVKDDSASSTISTKVSGRVKKIYAATGKQTNAVIAEYGTLMVLSIDGKMAVDFESSQDLAVGDSVDVILSDGTSKTGTVAKSTDKQCTVTLTDNGPELDENVTIQDDGNKIGEGSLYINQPITIAGSGGTIKTIHVSENQSISTGKKVITLKDVPQSSEYTELLRERSALMESYHTLIVISQTNSIMATDNGTLQTLQLSDGTTVGNYNVDSSSSNGSTGSYQGLSNNAATSGTIQLLSASGSASTASAGLQLLSNDASSGDGTTTTVTEIQNLNGLNIEGPATGAKPQTSITKQTEFSGTISWSPSDLVFKAGTVYSATITLTANSGYKFPPGFVPTVIGATISNLSINADTEQNSLKFTLTFGKTAAETSDDPSESQNGSDKNSSAQNGNSGTQGSGSISGGIGRSSGGSFSITGSSGATGTTGTAANSTDSSSANNSSSDIAAISIAKDETMVVSINVDELDINSVTKGMVATITLDAVENEEFSGEITKIAATSSSSSGVAKYAVEIQVEWNESMRSGMSASATILISEQTNVLRIPVDAIQERGGTVFVYTEMDEETNMPSGQVEVTTGLSDGEYVEITEGLSEGDTVYYISVSSDSEEMMSGFGNFSMGGGPNMVRGNGGTREFSGEMPDGAGTPPNMG